MAHFVQPTSRDEFHIAIICALPCEVDAITPLFDEFWDEESDPFGRASGDTNTYTTGRLGKFNVVLALLPHMGSNSAAGATASLRSSYSNLELAFLVGVCSGVPRTKQGDILLGDVVISKVIIQYDFGRQYPEGFRVRNTVEDSLGRANREIRGMLMNMETIRKKNQILTKAAEYLKHLQNAAIEERQQANYHNPGAAQNILFSEDYIHRHRSGQCDTCNDPDSSEDICELASNSFCNDLRCDKTQAVRRDASELQHGRFDIFIGRIGSGNTMMKSGRDRDRIATQHNLIAFEMEGAGAWDEIPCLVVKGVADYADCHKDKSWQDFAAATAACVTKAILNFHTVTDGAQRPALAQSNGEMISTLYLEPFPSVHTSIGQLQQNGTRSITGNSFGNNVRISQGDMTWYLKH